MDIGDKPKNQNVLNFEATLAETPRFIYLDKLLTENTTDPDILKIYDCQLCYRMFLIQNCFVTHLVKEHTSAKMNLTIIRYKNCHAFIFQRSHPL